MLGHGGGVTRGKGAGPGVSTIVRNEICLLLCDRRRQILRQVCPSANRRAQIDQLRRHERTVQEQLQNVQYELLQKEDAYLATSTGGNVVIGWETFTENRGGQRRGERIFSGE